MTRLIKRNDLIYPELSYVIVGCSFNVYNELGSGHHEKYYERALNDAFREKGLRFEQQVSFPIKYKQAVVGRKRLDFLVEGKIVVELKKGNRFSKSHIDQVLEYLKMNGLKLAILINFGSNGVLFRRIINFQHDS